MKFMKKRIFEAKYILKNDPACKSLFEAMFLYPSLRAIMSHHKAKKLYEKGHTTLARWISQRARHRTGIEIHPGATIGENVFIDHGTGVVIGETAIVGDRVTIYHGVTLGGTGKVKNIKRHPTIENDVLIGTGATILGDVTIGSHCKIGAGALVLQDIPKDSTAVGMPVKIIPHGPDYVFEED